MKILLLLLTCIIYVNSNASTKYIWLHGIESEGDRNPWKIYKNFYSPNHGYIFNYKPNRSIRIIASEIYQNNLKQFEDSNRIVIVGHNMGGLIARSIQLQAKSVSGIVTIGTPHNGSTLLKNIFKGRSFDFFNHALRKIDNAFEQSKAATQTEAVHATFFSLLENSKMAEIKKGTEKNLVTLKTTYNSLINQIARSQPSVLDLIPNSAYLKNINAAPHNVPIINIYGAEHYRQTVRAMGSYSRFNEVRNAANTDTSYDETFIAGLNIALSMINQLQNAHKIIYNILAVPALATPHIWLCRENIHSANKEWGVVYRYLDVGMHADFASNMGAVEYKQVNLCIPTRVDLFNLNAIRKMKPHIIDNDGILSSNDAKLNESISNVRVYNIRADGVNHFEMGNHIKMRKIMHDIINLQKYGAAFKQ